MHEALLMKLLTLMPAYGVNIMKFEASQMHVRNLKIEGMRVISILNTQHYLHAKGYVTGFVKINPNHTRT